uniref:TCF25 ribosome quality control complex subunit n=1 Tax=Mandrillus leucophaeus TaxID=9568 RepID=A0A2K5ZZ58_MANLE
GRFVSAFFLDCRVQSSWSMPRPQLRQRRPGRRRYHRENHRHGAINIDDLEDDPVVNGERSGCALTDTTARGNKGRARRGNTESKTDGDVAGTAPPEQSNASGKLRKKKKKQKNKKSSAGEASENVLEDIDRILERIEDSTGLNRPGPAPLSSRKHILYVEHRHLNPDTELKRYFGARAGPRQEHEGEGCAWSCPRHSPLPGLSMRLLESRKGLSFFAFEHSEEYQQAQHKFLVAVESMEPNNIVVLLQTSPYHVDSLLQLSDACRFQEDQEMARDLVGKAEPPPVPLLGRLRQEYRSSESFYLALYKQMSFLEKRGCPRTALEYCKLILSLEPDEDPLCMLLLIDHLALRARNYEYLIRLFQEWEVGARLAHRNLSQLPNFAFSVPLAYFLLSQQTDLPEHERSSAREKASLLIQQALTMFPGVLLPLLESCSVRPDITVSSHSFFGPNAEIRPWGTCSRRQEGLWRWPQGLSFDMGGLRSPLLCGKAQVGQVISLQRKVLYQRAPRNIHRHVILSEIKEAVAALPPDVTTQSVMGFDPLPPSDTIYSYVRPERLSPVSHGNTIALFFRSLLPNYTVEGERPEEGVAGGLNRNQGLNRLMLAVRDMMANFHLNDLEAPHEDDADGEGEWD